MSCQWVKKAGWPARDGRAEDGRGSRRHTASRFGSRTIRPAAACQHAPGQSCARLFARRSRDLTRIRFVSDPRIAPDGRTVAFVGTTLSEEKDEYLSNIWVVSTAGGEPRRFTTGPRRDTAPRWSPDGSRLAFISEREAKKKGQLYVMPAAGGEPVRLTDLRNGVSAPEWSPDGTRLTFVARVGGWQEPESEEEKRKSKPPRVITAVPVRGFTYDQRPHVFVVAEERRGAAHRGRLRLPIRVVAGRAGDRVHVGPPRRPRP
jgi:dipeptidyl aminopeptidase/acylaminoacyl peptidase